MACPGRELRRAGDGSGTRCVQSGGGGAGARGLVQHGLAGPCSTACAARLHSPPSPCARVPAAAAAAGAAQEQRVRSLVPGLNLVGTQGHLRVPPTPAHTHTHTRRCGDCDLFRQLGMPSIGRERQTESGIILVDRRRHWLVLEWALWLNTNDHITYKLACEGRLVAAGRGERATQELLPPGRACRRLALARNKSAAARSTLLATHS